MPPLAEVRQKAGLSAAQLAARAGVERQLVAEIEAGEVEHVDASAAQAIAGALGVNASSVFEFRDSLGLTALGETGAGETAPTGSPRSDS